MHSNFHSWTLCQRPLPFESSSLIYHRRRCNSPNDIQFSFTQSMEYNSCKSFGSLIFITFMLNLSKFSNPLAWAHLTTHMQKIPPLINLATEHSLIHAITCTLHWWHTHSTLRNNHYALRNNGQGNVHSLLRDNPYLLYWRVPFLLSLPTLHHHVSPPTKVEGPKQYITC